MAGEQITHAELMEALRQEGCTALSKVRYAVLENDGAITIGLRSDKRAGQARHMLLPMARERLRWPIEA